jgi:chromosomal replication initiator protein
LLIDDIQFIGSKEQTQSEFFHTFNTLYQNNKQVVLTSDRAPRDIKALESRLRSRFEGGMLVDISPPNIETRLAILQEKQNAEGVEVPDNIIEYIARHVKNNIRELEGALNKIMAHARLRQEMPGLKESISILESLVREPIRKTTNNRAILKCVSEFYGIPTKDIISRGRKQEVVKPRQVAMYLMRLECNTSYPSIGDEVGGRDHTTAIHSYKQVENNLRNNELLNDEIESIRERLYS